MITIRKSAKRYIEDVLSDYPEIDKYIAYRKEELIHPIKPKDENVGGGRGSKVSRPQERIVVTIDQDKRLVALEHQKIAIGELLDKSDMDTKIIIGELYFKKRPEYTIEGLVTNGIVNLSRASLFRKRDNFIYKLSKELDVY